MEQAIRVTAPTQSHPATGRDAADSPSDARVVWREHWDIEQRRPFYHNIETNCITWLLPDGFPTRFLFYYNRLADEAGMGHVSAEHTQGSKVARAVGAAGRRSWKERLKDYGAAGFILYGVVHFGSLTFVFLLLWCGVDVAGLARGIGFDLPKSGPAASGGSVFALWLLAVAVNKIFSPIHLLTTLALAPTLAPIMRRSWLRVYGSKFK